MFFKPPNPKYIPKPYEKMLYPGQRVQIDVKFVPESCIVGDAKAEGRKFYQYTAIDEYSRFRYLAMIDCIIIYDEQTIEIKFTFDDIGRRAVKYLNENNITL